MAATGFEATEGVNQARDRVLLAAQACLVTVGVCGERVDSPFLRLQPFTAALSRVLFGEQTQRHRHLRHHMRRQLPPEHRSPTPAHRDSRVRHIRETAVTQTPTAPDPASPPHFDPLVDRATPPGDQVAAPFRPTNP